MPLREIKCRIDGCRSVIGITEPACSDVKYLCSRHPRAVAYRAIGRTLPADTERN
jgi:hypothetical protein